MATDLSRIRRKAEEDTTLVFTSLYHHVYDIDNLRQSYKRMKPGKTPGIDGVTKEEYGENLEENLKNLSEQLARMGYRPPPTKRKYIKKAGSHKKRSLGMPCFESKLVENALKEVLEQIYEPYFTESSYGYRPGRTHHQALDAVGRCIQQRKISYVVDADIKGFFDQLNHDWLLKFLRHRIGDPRILRMITRFLKSGIMEEGQVHPTTKGTPQGGVLSPLLSNIYLHYVLDLWCEKRVTVHSRGQAHHFRFADDFIGCFQYKEDAERYLTELRKRLQKFHLELEESKTRLLAFGRFAEESARRRGRKPDTFDFLGFTHYSGKTRNGQFKVKRRTSRKKYNAKLKEVNLWMKHHRSRLTKHQLIRKVRLVWIGHLNYYAITDNWERCDAFGTQLTRILYKWLNRQSQRRSYTWEGLNQMLRWKKWPSTRIKVKLCPFRKEALT